MAELLAHSDRRIRALVDRLGLSDKLRFSTTAAPLLAGNAPEQYTQPLASMSYLGVICTVVALARPLTGGYLTYITDDTPFTGIVEISNLRADPDFVGASIVYLPRYTVPDDPDFDADLAELGPASSRHCCGTTRGWTRRTSSGTPCTGPAT